MEPFGLFDLLKTLFPDPPKNADSEPQNPNPNAVPNAAPNTSPVTKNTPEEGVDCPYHAEQTNACLEFMTKHDERARQVKKR